MNIPTANKRIGQRIKQYLDLIGKSTKQCADDCDLNYDLLNKVIRGERGLSVKYSLILDAYFKLEQGQLYQLYVNAQIKDLKQDDEFFMLCRSVRYD